MTPSTSPTPPVPARSPHVWALIPCAGQGSRALRPDAARRDLPKQYQPVAGQPMVWHTLRAFAAVQHLHGVLVVVAPGDRFLAGEQQGRVQVRDCGGPSRAATVLAGLHELQAQGAGAQDWVLVHDAARCLVTPALIEALIDACLDDPVGGLLALPLADTLKQSRTGRVSATLERADKWLAQTPQMFRLGLLLAALQAAGDSVTDEAGAIEAAGLQPLLVTGSSHNFKVTWPQDFELAQAVLSSRLNQARGSTGT